MTWLFCRLLRNMSYYVVSPARNPTGPASGDRRVLRGGSWNHDVNHVRAANRYGNYPDGRDVGYGVRCLLLSQ